MFNSSHVLYVLFIFSGGTKQLIPRGSTKIVVGGLPDTAPNTTTVDNKVVKAAIYDVRYRNRRSAVEKLGVTTDGRAVKSVGGDMQGLIYSSLDGFKIALIERLACFPDLHHSQKIL